MAYRQVSDIMNMVNDFHQQLTKEIRRHADCNNDVRLDLLADFLKYQRDIVSQAVQRDEDVYPEIDVLGTWIQYVPDDDIQEAIDRLHLQSGEPLDALFTHVLEADRALVKMYESLAKQTQASHVQEFFNSLRRASVSFAEQRSWGLR